MVGQAKMLGTEERNQTVYLRIGTNVSDHLILPVEMEISSAPGIYSATDSIDFGLIFPGSAQTEPTATISLINSAKDKMIYVTSIEAEPPNPGLEFVEFNPTLISPDGNAQQIAKLKFLRKDFEKNFKIFIKFFLFK